MLAFFQFCEYSFDFLSCIDQKIGAIDHLLDYYEDLRIRKFL